LRPFTCGIYEIAFLPPPILDDERQEKIALFLWIEQKKRGKKSTSIDKTPQLTKKKFNKPEWFFQGGKMKTNSISKADCKGAAIFATAVFTAVCIFVFSPAARADAGGFDSWEDGIHYRNGFQIVHLTLLGVADYGVTEIFNDILTQTPGVTDAKRTRLHIDPDRPQSCFVTWRVQAADIGVFELESRIYRILRDISRESPDAPVIAYNFMPSDRDLESLGYIRPFQSSSMGIQFLMARPLPRIEKRANRGHTMRGNWPRHSWGNRGFE
jgi:hypothetical protein